MITHIHAHDFKSWDDIRDFRLAPITGLFGSNSSGKTSLLQLLLLLKQTAASPDRAQVLNLGDERSVVEFGQFSDIIYRHRANSPLGIGLHWQLKKKLEIEDPALKGNIVFEGSSLDYHGEISSDKGKRMTVSDFSYGFAGYRFGMKRKTSNKYELYAQPELNGPGKFKFIRSQGRVWELPRPMKCYGFPDQVRGYFQNAGFLSDFELKFEELFSDVFYLGPLREYPKRQYKWTGGQPADVGERGEKVIEALLASREQEHTISRGKGQKRLTVEEYVSWWLKKLNLIHDFSVKKLAEESNLYRVSLKRTSSSAEVLITEVGFGISQILPVITICYYVPEGSVILMEQPEIHLHPAVQAELADVFIDAVEKRNIQIIIESHSEHLLRRLQRRIAEKRLSHEKAALYFCSLANEHSHLTPLKLDQFGYISNWPDNFFGDEIEEMHAITMARMKRKKEEQE
jgi:predicted ATPase